MQPTTPSNGEDGHGSTPECALDAPLLEGGASRTITLGTHIVGCKYCLDAKGFIDQWRETGEAGEVSCCREPDNPMDPNAIAVHFSEGQLGHLPAYLATLLAPLFASDAFTVSGRTTHAYHTAMSKYALYAPHPT
jgi:hypothetical protein